jgi:hypothetical protein
MAVGDEISDLTDSFAQFASGLKGGLEGRGT